METNQINRDVSLPTTPGVTEGSVRRPLRLRRPCNPQETEQDTASKPTVPPSTPPRVAANANLSQFPIHNTVPRRSVASQAQTAAEARMLVEFRNALENQTNGWKDVAHQALKREKEEKRVAEEAKKELERVKARNAKLYNRLTAVAKLIQDGNEEGGSQILAGGTEDEDLVANGEDD